MNLPACTLGQALTKLTLGKKGQPILAPLHPQLLKTELIRGTEQTLQSPNTLLQHCWPLNQLIMFCSSLIFFTSIFVSFRFLATWQFNFPFFPPKRHLGEHQPCNTTWRASWKAESQQREVNSPIKQQACWVAWPCCTSPACERWYSKIRQFAERRSRVWLRNLNYTQRIVTFIFKTAQPAIISKYLKSAAIIHCKSTRAQKIHSSWDSFPHNSTLRRNNVQH